MTTKVGPYEIIGTLGSGGMSSVSLARSPSGVLVVLKKQHHPEDDESLRDEARVGVRLLHPSIVETLDLVEHQGRPVLVVSYVSGATLADLRATGPLPVPVLFRVGRQIAEALHAIHTATDEDGSPLQMLHRDVTPSNIMLGHDGQARLIDLGIARSAVSRRERTQAGYLKGTLRYLAPEVLKGADYTPSSDLWSLGMSLWESAIGRYAVDGSDTNIYAAIVNGKAMQLRPGEEMDPRLRHAVGQLLAMDPGHRLVSAGEAAIVFRNFGAAFEDEEVDQLARDLVLRAVGPEGKLKDGAAELLVNRAAATFGGPLGDWRVAPEFATSGHGVGDLQGDLPFPHVDLARMAPVDVTEPLAHQDLAARAREDAEIARARREAPVLTPTPQPAPAPPVRPPDAPRSGASAAAPRPSHAERRGTEVPAPLDFGDAPIPERDPSYSPLRTEVLSVEEAKQRAREVAARYRELAEQDSWLLEATVVEDAEAGPRGGNTDPEKDGDVTVDGDD